MTNFTILLFDNGSLRPEATFRLRALAKQLSDAISMKVEPVSLLHSCKIKPKSLNGLPATIIRRRFKEAIQMGEKKFICVPLFLGPSLAITEYLVELIDEAKSLDPEMTIHVAEPLCGSDVNHPDERLVMILKELIEAAITSSNANYQNIVLVDHGSPIEKMAFLRNAIAEKLSVLFRERRLKITASSMERREGEAYVFNEPLLETIPDYLGLKPNESLMVAMFFLMPGRHAGDGGDVDAILQSLQKQNKICSYKKTELIATHPIIIDLLADRVKSVLINKLEA